MFRRVWSRIPSRLALPLLFLSLFAPSLRASVWYVQASASGPTQDGTTWATAYTTVGAALISAASGDEIWVAEGTYPERVTMKIVGLYGGFSGSETERDQRDPVSHPTILDGEAKGSVITGTALAGAVIDGFTIRNGSGTDIEGTRYGGGMLLRNSGPILRRLTLTMNRAFYGGGIATLGGSPPLIEDCTFLSNTAEGASGGGYYSSSGSPTIRRCLFRDNRAAFSGGALYMATSNSTIEDCVVIGNSADDSGAGLLISLGSPVIQRNVIAHNIARNNGGGILAYADAWIIANRMYGNTAGFSGGGIYAESQSPVIFSNLLSGNGAQLGGALYVGMDTKAAVVNNTILGNCAVGTFPDMVGGSVEFSGSGTLANNIIAYNQSGFLLNGSVAPWVRYNLVYANEAFDYRGMADPTGTNGNRREDPCLAGPQVNDGHLKPESPCRDAGNTAYVRDYYQDRSVDVDGEPRILNNEVDIGADESNGTDRTVSVPVFRVSPNGDDTHDGSTWLLPFKTIQAAVDAARVHGTGEIWVRSGTYYEQVRLGAYMSIYGGFAGTEVNRDERDAATNTTEIDAQLAGTALSMHGGWTNPVADGLTIKKAGEFNGAGIFISTARASVSHCVITANQTVGISLIRSVGWITDSVIKDNGWQGVLSTNSHLIAERNTVARNDIGFATSGTGSTTLRQNDVSANVRAGMVCASDSNLLDRNHVHGNIDAKASYNEQEVAGVSVTKTSTLIGNVVAGNISKGSTGGLVVDGTATLINNTIINNAGPMAGGIRNKAASLTLANNVIAFNTSGIRNDASVSPETSNNCVYGNRGGDYAGMVDPTGTDGNISADPQIVRLEVGDFHIQPDSPCVNAADSSLAEPDSVDMDGQARIQGGGLDIGADESDGTSTLPYQRIVRVLPAGDDTNDGSTWATAMQTIQAAVNAVEGTGEVWVGAGEYPESVRMGENVRLLGGFKGVEDSADQRDPMQNETILDGRFVSPALTVDSGSQFGAVDGLTLRNGMSPGGLALIASFTTVSRCRIQNNFVYGVDAQYSSAIIRNCQITGNPGGIRLSYGSTVIEDNLLTANGSQNPGISVTGGSSPIRRNTIVGKGRLGTGIDLTLGTGGRISNNLVYGWSTGVRSANFTQKAGIANNTIVGNATGLYISNYNQVIVNNILAFNDVNLQSVGASGLQVLANNVYGGNPDYSGTTDRTGISGNIRLDPRFVDPANHDYRLARVSPCIDAGNDPWVLPDAMDLDRASRRQGAHVDIGAYEYAGRWEYTLADATRALRIAAGFLPSGRDDVNLLDLQIDDPVSAITAADVAAILKRLPTE